MEITRMQRLEQAIRLGAPMSLPEILEEEIRLFRESEEYRHMIEADSYYANRSDVQRKTTDLARHSNTKIEHPILKKLVDQKADYLLGKPFTVNALNDTYSGLLNEFMGDTFRRKIKSLVKGAVKSGIAYLAPYIDTDGKLQFMRLPSTEVVPIWVDEERTRMDGYIRFYDQVVYQGRLRKVIQKVEYWDTNGVQFYQTAGEGTTRLFPDPDRKNQSYHFIYDGQKLNWARLPLCWLKYNEEERPLCYYVKELIDDINWQTSVTADVLRDIAKFIYILKGYGGADLAELVSDLKKYLAVKVERDGGVDKLQADLNIDAVMAFLEKNRRDIYDYANAVDIVNTDLGNASGVAINFRYMGLDTDCASIGAELKDTFQQMKPFIDACFQMDGSGNYSDCTFDVVFNMDLPVNETDIINNVRNSEGIISKRTILQNHPWVKDVDEELEQLRQEKKELARNVMEELAAETSHMGGTLRTGEWADE